MLLCKLKPCAVLLESPIFLCSRGSLDVCYIKRCTFAPLVLRQSPRTHGFHLVPRHGRSLVREKETPLDVYFLIWVNGKCGRGAGCGSCPDSSVFIPIVHLTAVTGAALQCVDQHKSQLCLFPPCVRSLSLLVSSQPAESFTSVMRHQARNSRPVLAFVLEASHTHTGGQGANIGSCLRVYHSHPAKLGRATAVGTFRNHMTVSCTHFVLCHH